MTTASPIDFFKKLKTSFPHEPTLTQERALEAFAQFVCNDNKDELLLLKGYAGTGKTTLIGTLVNQLWQIKYKSVLMAPTGRAAKVMAGYAKTEAFTIHRKIYFPKKAAGGGIQFTKAPNKHRHTIFIVDEASMIPDTPEGGKNTTSLLDDLITYVYSGHKCKLVLVGDVAQLPPVHLSLSPALNEETLQFNYSKTVPL
ncbi:MAG: AAA family ATPase, partial [Flavobacteriaceae bacterium]|nr:AAA family ATPase [Flavobacteriaceae bacterium]